MRGVPREGMARTPMPLIHGMAPEHASFVMEVARPPPTEESNLSPPSCEERYGTGRGNDISRCRVRANRQYKACASHRGQKGAQMGGPRTVGGLI